MKAYLFDERVRLRQEDEKAALATIVQVRGSTSNFKTGKMLVPEDGSVLPTVGGAGVEAEVWAAAPEAITDEKSRVLCFDRTDESMSATSDGQWTPMRVISE